MALQPAEIAVRAKPASNILGSSQHIGSELRRRRRPPEWASDRFATAMAHLGVPLDIL